MTSGVIFLFEVISKLSAMKYTFITKHFYAKLAPLLNLLRVGFYNAALSLISSTSNHMIFFQMKPTLLSPPFVNWQREQPSRSVLQRAACYTNLSKM